MKKLFKKSFKLSKNQELKKNRLIYFLLFLTALFFYGIYNHYMGLVFFLMVISVFILSLSLSLIALLQTKVNVKGDFKNSSINIAHDIEIEFKSLFRFPYPRVEVEYFIQQPFALYREHEIVPLENNTFPLTFKHCGKVELKLKNLNTYDLLCMIPLKTKLQKNYEYYIYPTIIPVGNQIELFHSNKRIEKGDDLTEIFELRNYKEGDSLRSIHWKLSSKKNELITKVGSNTDGLGTTLFLKLTHDPTTNDETLSLFHSMALELLKTITFNIAYVEEDMIQIVMIDSLDQYMSVLDHILSLPLKDQDEFDLKDIDVYTFYKGGMSYED